jgi:hypothetical protein
MFPSFMLFKLSYIHNRMHIIKVNNNLGPEQAILTEFSCSVSSEKFGSTQITRQLLLPHPLQFNIHYSPQHSTL